MLTGFLHFTEDGNTLLHTAWNFDEIVKCAKALNQNSNMKKLDRLRPNNHHCHLLFHEKTASSNSNTCFIKRENLSVKLTLRKNDNNY